MTNCGRLIPAFVFTWLLLPGFSLAQTGAIPFFKADTTYNPARIRTIVVASSVMYGATMTGLYALWYSGYKPTSFHLFDDSDEWLQMDKMGHVTTSYYLGVLGIGTMKWAGVKGRKAAWYGILTGTIFQTSVELFDGISPQWGFSFSDVAANSAGSVMALAQELWWEEQRIVLKVSFHRSSYAPYRPALLGSRLTEEMLKDYNGQTYWLSANIASFLKKESKFPRWLSLAVGYGAEGMTGGKVNPPEVDGKAIPSFKRYRQFYLSPDIELSGIPAKPAWLSAVFKTFGFIKIPAPALEFNQGGKTRVKWLYF